MSVGANLEKSSLKWLDELTRLEKHNGERVGGILLASAARTLTDLRGTYQKLVDDGGDSQRFTIQQQSARFNAIRKKVSDLVGPAEAKLLGQMYRKDLAAASVLGQEAGLDLSQILKQKNKTIQTNAKPNMGAIENAGLRLKDFWAKENSSFRDRITALTQTAAAQGKSYRQLSLQVRELLILERNQGTESARSTAINNRLGIVGRAQLIARTELATAYVQGKIAKYKEIGYSWARWSAAGERSCPYCISRDGLVYLLEDIESSIPAHPRCRCTPIPASPPMGWDGKGDPEEQAAQMARDGDDAYWAKSRQEKLDQWAQRNNGKKVDLERYVNEPTNTAKFLLGQEKAPAPIWAPSGSLSPDLSAVVLAANKAAQMTKDEADAADLAQQAKAAEKLAKQKAEEEAAAAKKAEEEAAAAKKAAEEAAAKKAAEEAAAAAKKKAAEEAAAKKAADLATVIEGFPAMKKADVEAMFNNSTAADQAKLLTLAKESIVKAKAAAKAKDDEDFQLVNEQYGIDAATWKLSEPSVKENLVTMAKKSIAEAQAIDLANKKLVEDWFPQEAGGWSGLTPAEKDFAIKKATAKKADFEVKDAADFALAKQAAPGLKKEAWDSLPEGTKANFVKKAEDMIQKAKDADAADLALVQKAAPSMKQDVWDTYPPAKKAEAVELAKVKIAKIDQADIEAYALVAAELPGQEVGWKLKTPTEKADLQEAAEAKQAAKAKAAKDAAAKAAPDPAQVEADFVAKWNSNFTAESFLAAGPVVQKYALKLAQATQAKSEAIAAGKTILETSLAKYTIPQLKSIAKTAGIDVVGLNKQGILDTLYQVQGGVWAFKPKGFYGPQKTPFEILIDPSLAPAPTVKAKKPTKAEAEAAAKDQAIATILKADPTAKLGDLLVKDLATIKAQEKQALAKLQKIEEDALAELMKPGAASIGIDGKLVVGKETFAPGPTLAGSTKPVLFQDAAGTGRFVVKGGGKPGQNIAEHTSHLVYEVLRKDLGIGGSQSRLTADGKLVNTFIQGGRTIDGLSAAEQTKFKVSKAIRDGHMADALLANWDYVGLSRDNIMLGLDGKFSKIDAGGTFHFRAQGAAKAYENVPMEVFSLRGQQGAPHWAKATDSDYGDLWIKQTGAMVKNDTALRAAVRNSQLPREVKIAYERRLDTMQQVHETLVTNNFQGKTIEEWTSGKDAGVKWQDIDEAMQKAFTDLQGKTPGSPEEWRKMVDFAVKKRVEEVVVEVEERAARRAKYAGLVGSKDRAAIEALRGTTKGHFEGTLWDQHKTAYSGTESRKDPKVIQAVVDQYERATGQKITKAEASELLDAVRSYTNGGYTPMVADQLKRNNPESYQIMVDNFKAAGHSAPQPKNGDIADKADKLTRALPVWRGGELVRGVGFNSEAVRDRFISNIGSGQPFGAIASWANGSDSSWGSGSKRVVLHVKDPVTAASVDGISSHKGEKEVLYPADVRFDLVKQENRGGVLHVYLEELL